MGPTGLLSEQLSSARTVQSGSNTALGSCPNQPGVWRPDPLRGLSRGPREPPEQIPAIVCVNLVSVVLSCKRLKESNSDRGGLPLNSILVCRFQGGLFENNSIIQYLAAEHISGHFNIHLWHTSGENAGLFPIFLTVSPDKPLLHNLAQSLILWETRSTEFPFYSEPPPFRAITCYFLDALAPPSTYPCQWVRQWVSESFIVSDWRFLSHLFQLNWLF